MRGSCRPLINTSLTFLPNHRHVILLDACNGLLLCLWFTSAQGTEFRYVVCNPATGKWVALPDPNQVNKEDVLHLGLSFDPAVSSHFHVFAFLKEKAGGVEVYSSETGTWVYKDNCWNGDIMLANHPSASVFLDGYMHFHAFHREPYHCLAVVDTKGETAAHFRVPGGIYEGFIQKSQGCLHYVNFQRDEGSGVIRLVVYVLKDYGSKEWTLKHSSETAYIFGENLAYLHPHFEWIMIHPDCNLIFFTVGHGIWCYNMDRRQVKLITGTEYCMGPYLPYVPLYSELPSLHE
jgi:F-box interacting protein